MHDSPQTTVVVTSKEAHPIPSPPHVWRPHCLAGLWFPDSATVDFQESTEKPAGAVGVSETPSPQCQGNATSTESSYPTPTPRLCAQSPTPQVLATCNSVAAGKTGPHPGFQASEAKCQEPSADLGRTETDIGWLPGSEGQAPTGPIL